MDSISRLYILLNILLTIEFVHCEFESDNAIEFRVNENTPYMLQDNEFSIDINEIKEFNASMFDKKFVSGLKTSEIIARGCEYESYQVPRDILKLYPGYLSGFDEDRRPIWVAEGGLYDLRKVTRGSKEIQDNFEKYLEFIGYRILKSLFASYTEASFSNQTTSSFRKPPLEFIVLIDSDGISMSQLTYGNLQLAWKLVQRYYPLVEMSAKEIIVINANYVTQQAINFLRPVFGQMLERVRTFGTERGRWLSYLRNNYPKTALPPWYGGVKGFKPVEVFGRWPINSVYR